jgi:hypothetical protein
VVIIHQTLLGFPYAWRFSHRPGAVQASAVTPERERNLQGKVSAGDLVADRREPADEVSLVLVGELLQFGSELREGLTLVELEELLAGEDERTLFHGAVSMLCVVMIGRSITTLLARPSRGTNVRDVARSKKGERSSPPVTADQARGWR